jgi:DNA-directed RNA polymerase specialized sigma24 family protein
MPQKIDLPHASANPASPNPASASLAGPNSPEQLSAGVTGGLEEIVEQIAAGLYSLASMLVGEGEESERLVETAIADADISVCQDPEQARQSSRRALSAAALGLLAARCPGCLEAPEGLAPASTCIEDDDLASAGISSEELESMIAGPERDRVRKWLASLPATLRTVFVLRAVAGFTAAETSEMLRTHSGPQAAPWNPEAVREVFRQGLCSLASQLLHASAAR